jgi:hypothetical protein
VVCGPRPLTKAENNPLAYFIPNDYYHVGFLSKTDCWAALVLLLTCCQSATQSQPEQPAAPAAGPLAPSAPATPAALYLGYHRYRGTVGGRPVTVALIIGPEPGSDATSAPVCEGHYSYDRQAGGHLLLRAPRPFQTQQPLRLTEYDSAHPEISTGEWQASQPAGTLLAGTWTSPRGRTLPFVLHEDYHDGHGQLAAVPYELLTEQLDTPCQPEREDDESKAAYRERVAQAPSGYSRDFLHLLGPDTLRPALRALQCPPHARRLRQLKAEVKELGDCTYRYEGLTVEYMDYGILSLASSSEEYSMGNAHPTHSTSTRVVDLHTGAELLLADVIKPGADSALRRFLTLHFADNPEVLARIHLNSEADEDPQVPVPAGGFGVVAEGLSFDYADYELVSYAGGMPSAIISWAELLPLLRPDSPVARMLRERGLWPPARR